MLVQNIDVTDLIAAGKQGDGGVIVAIIHGRDPLRAARIRKIIRERMERRIKRPEILTGVHTPTSFIPSGMLPAGEGLQPGFIFRIDKRIILDAGGNKARGGFVAGLIGQDESI